MQDRLIFPRHLIPRAGAAKPESAVQIEITTPDGSVPAWLLLPPDRREGERFGMVVWCHGNAESIDQATMADEVQMYREARLAVLLPEYRGYARAPGAPSQAKITADAAAFYELAVARPEIDPARVAFFGRSLGGGVALQLYAALRENNSSRASSGSAQIPMPRAIALQSTFTSVASFAWGYGVPGFLVRHPFRSDRVLPTVDVPVLVMHGDIDTTVPVSHGRRLRDLARDVTFFEQHADHLDFPADFGDYRDRIFAFLERSGVMATGGAR